MKQPLPPTNNMLELFLFLAFQVALRSLPEEAVKETLEYKVLQSQFSLLYSESLQVKTQLDEARALLLTHKNSHLRHIEHLEVKELWAMPPPIPRTYPELSA